MAVVAQHPHPLKLPIDSPDLLNTLPDPRTPSTSSTTSRNDSVVDSVSQPDLNDEIAKLSEKLVNAINHQTNLDDSLQQSRHDLELARQNVVALETRVSEHERLISSGLLLPKATVDKRENKLKSDLAAEKDLRLKADKEKKAMEQELETLTSALFTEANTMVSDARREKEASDKRNEQLKKKLADTETLLLSHQQQLQDLKSVMEKMSAEQEPDESTTNSSNPPSSPAHDRMSRLFDTAHFPSDDNTTTTNTNTTTTPEPPLHFSHLIQPVLRTDVYSYDEFATLLKAARAASPPPSRVPSGSYGSLNVLGSPPATSPSFPAKNPGSPRSSTTSTTMLPSMRESKVFKRALAEDIEPTLRLDIAPGISWMIRRAVLNSLINGTLVVEPMPPPPTKFRGPVNPCSLCGENRVGDVYARKHRFRVSEDKEKRPFPLCELCLGRLRSCGDLLSFLRMVSGGHWKAESEEEIKGGWEEFVRLRERMFWRRVVGGVVPAGGGAREESKRNSVVDGVDSGVQTDC